MPKDRTVNDPIYTRNPANDSFLEGYGYGTASRHYRSDAAANREAAQRAVDQVAATYASLEAIAKLAPWRRGLTSAERHGRLFTLAEVISQTAANKLVARGKAQAKAKATRTRDTGSFRGRARRAGGFDPIGGNVVFESLAFEVVSRALDRDARRQQQLRINRRGAGATRVLQPTAAGLTNRTGAASTRRTTDSGRAVSVLTAARLPSGDKAGAVRTVPRGTRGLDRPSNADQEARKVMGSSNKLPTATTKAGKSTWEKLLSQQLTQFVSPTRSISSGLQGVRLGSTKSESLAKMLSPSSKTGTQTPLALGIGTQVGVGTQTASRDCNCPRPKTRKPPRDSCRNPVVSKVIADGFITTKRKIQCQPSRMSKP